ncbi:MAG: hypothetical protein D8H97_24195 [Neisseria sp.]|nr:MAG: hypothetical protein D8H97_24195 [Neisseria sp.]
MDLAFVIADTLEGMEKQIDRLKDISTGVGFLEDESAIYESGRIRSVFEALEKLKDNLEFAAADLEDEI